MTVQTRPRAFLVGAPKAGTSALGLLLAQHPQISMCRIKEPNYFCSDLDLPRPRSENEYLSLFETTPETRLLADASILYLYSRTAAAGIAEYVPDPRILIILRDPVEAMYAWHSQMVFTANEPITDFEAALQAEPLRKAGRSLPRVGNAKRCPQMLFYREVMRYAEQIERYLARFDRDVLHIMAYDDFKTGPDLVYAGILGFLDLDPGFRPETRVINVNKVRRSWALHYGLKKVFARPARGLLPLPVRLRMIQVLDRWNSRQERRPQMDPQVRAALREECEPDIRRLSEITGRDFTTLWCS